MREVPEIIPLNCTKDAPTQSEEGKKPNLINLTGAVFCTIKKDGRDVEVIKLPIFIGYTMVEVLSGDIREALLEGMKSREQASVFGFKAYNHMAIVGEGNSDL